MFTIHLRSYTKGSIVVLSVLDRQHLDGFIRCSIRQGYCAPELNPVHITTTSYGSIRRGTAPYRNVVIKHVDFYGSVHTRAHAHTHQVAVRRRMQHAKVGIKLDSICAACCVAARHRTATQVCPLTTTVSSIQFSICSVLRLCTVPYVAVH